MRTSNIIPPSGAPLPTTAIPLSGLPPQPTAASPFVDVAKLVETIMVRQAALSQQQMEHLQAMNPRPSDSHARSDRPASILASITKSLTFASSVDGAAPGPVSEFMTDILAAGTSAFSTLQGLRHRMDASGNMAHIFHATAQSLLRGQLSWSRPGFPSNLSFFAVAAIEQYSDLADFQEDDAFRQAKIEHGGGLEASDLHSIKNEYKPRGPTCVHTFTDQLRNFISFVEIVLGPGFIHQVLSHFLQWTTFHRRELAESARQIPNFFCRLAFAVDLRVHGLLERTRRMPEMHLCGFGQLDFVPLQRQIINQEYNPPPLPPCLSTNTTTSRPKNNSRSNSNSRSSSPTEPNKRSRNKQGGSSGRDEKKPKGDTVKNPDVRSDWKIQPSEHFFKIFLKPGKDKLIERAPVMDGCAVCLNWHIQGACHTSCDKLATHKIILPGPIFDQMDAWVKKSRDLGKKE
jgi:hypothetical protein